MEKTKKSSLKDEIINLVKNATKDNLGQIAKGLNNNSLKVDDYKEILELTIKEKGAGLIKILYENIKFKLDDEYKDHLIELAFNNTSNKPKTVFEFVITKLFPERGYEKNIEKLFNKYRENGKKFIKLAIIDNNIQLESFLKEKLNTYNSIILEIINNSIKDAKDKNDINNILKLFNNNSLTVSDRKEILKLAFKEKGALLIRELYKETEKNFKDVLDPSFKKELMELAFNNTSKYPDRSFIVVAKELIIDKQNQIDLGEIFNKYKENGIRLIELAIINGNKQLKNFFEEKLKTYNPKMFKEIESRVINNSKIKKDEIIEFVKNAKNGDDAINILQLFNNSKLTVNDRKEIFKLAVETKGISLVENLHKLIDFNLENDYINNLIVLAFNNTSRNPDKVFEFIRNKFPNCINDKIIKELFDKYKESSIRLIKSALINKETKLENFFKEKVGVDNIMDNIIEYSDDVELFSKFFEISTKSKEDFIKYANSTILKIYNIGNKEEMINSILENTKYPINIPFYNNSLISFLNESLLKNIKIDIPSLNKITEKIINKKELIEITKYENIYKNIKENQNSIVKSDKNTSNEPIEIQGENQTEILERNIEYNDNSLIESIKDTIYTNLKNENNRKLYEVIYKNNGVQEITYYKKDGADLVKISINKNGEINSIYSEDKINKKEIERILNDDYKSIDAFDHKLSYLSYALLQNEENVVFKTNCNNIEDIINITRDSIGKNKIFICDLNIDKHNVQIVINNGNTTILNSGKDFEYIKNKIENLIDIKGLQNIKVKHMETINQSSGNCVEASKLYTIVLSEKYKQQFGNLEKLTERLNNFQQFMEDTLNKTEKEQKNNLSNFKETENFEMLKVFLETNVQLLNEYEKHFYKMDERFKNFYKTLKKRDKTVSNEEDKIIDNKMEEMHKITNIISFGHEINKACEEGKINNEYKDIINYIIDNTKKIQKNSNINKIEALRKNKLLLKIIKYNIFMPIFETISKKFKGINTINTILKNRSSNTEKVFEDCIKEIGNLTKEELQKIKPIINFK